jgi:hypothetical protein
MSNDDTRAANSATEDQRKEILLKQKIETDERLAVLRRRLQQMHARARHQGVYSKEHSNLLKRVGRLKQESQQLQLEISKIKHEQQQSFEHHFIDIAKERLPAETFQAIVDLAQARSKQPAR